MTPAEAAYRAYQTSLFGALELRPWTSLSGPEQDAWKEAAAEAVREAGSEEHDQLVSQVNAWEEDYGELAQAARGVLSELAGGGKFLSYDINAALDELEKTLDS